MSKRPSAGDRINFELSHDEAVVLFELLADLPDGGPLQIPSSAERLALLRLSGALERVIVDPFCSDYRDVLSEARRRLSKQAGELL